MLTLVEPIRGKQILESLNHVVSSSHSLFQATSIASDIFVFMYPLFLIGLFLYGYKKKQIDTQYAGIQIVASVIAATAITIIIQQLIRKDRPESLPWLQLILSHVPTISFPSDHATVSMAIAVGTYLVSGKRKAESGRPDFLYICSLMLLAFSLIMWIARVAVAVHRPTDIIAWWIIWIIWWRIGRKLTHIKYIKNISQTIIKSVNKMIGLIVST